MNASALHPVARYVDGYSDLRDDPRDLVYAAITGVPPEVVGGSYDQILEHELMQEVVDPAEPNRLLPSCNVPGRGMAFPPRRIVTVARDLEQQGALTTVQTSCEEDLSPAIDAILRVVARSFEPRCP